MSSYTDFQVDLLNPNSSWTIIFNQIKNDAKILDVGCSSGYFDDILIKEKGCVVDGIEIDPSDAALAAKVCRNVKIGNVEDENFLLEDTDETYDYILFIDVLEHLLEPSKALKRVSSLLKKGGKIIFSIPNMANGAVRLQLLTGNFDYEKEGLLDETHLHFYTYETINRIVIAGSGLHLTALDFVTFDVPHAIVAAVLNKVGLEPTDNFNKFITAGDALAYQYIGTLAKEGKEAPAKFAELVGAIKPKLEYEAQLKAVQEDARNVFAGFTKLNDNIHRQQEEIDNKQAQIVKLESEKKELADLYAKTIKARTIKVIKKLKN